MTYLPPPPGPAPPDPAELAVVRRLCLSGDARRIRIAGGVSLAEVAAPVGVTPPAVHNWELGRRCPTGLAAVKYLDILRRLEASALRSAAV